MIEQAFVLNEGFAHNPELPVSAIGVSWQGQGFDIVNGWPSVVEAKRCLIEALLPEILAILEITIPVKITIDTYEVIPSDLPEAYISVLIEALTDFPGLPF